MKVDKSLVSGSTMLLILSLLKDGDMYGYEMVTELERRSEGCFQLKEGTLYPLLHNMEKMKYLKSYIKPAPNGKDRKYYCLTEAGRAQLEYKEEEWYYFSGKVNKVLGFSPA